MAFALAKFEFSGYLLVGTAKDCCVCSPVDNEEAMHLTVDACRTMYN
jgi:hypothetical protein